MTSILSFFVQPDFGAAPSFSDFLELYTYLSVRTVELLTNVPDGGRRTLIGVFFLSQRIDRSDSYSALR